MNEFPKTPEGFSESYLESLDENILALCIVHILRQALSGIHRRDYPGALKWLDAGLVAAKIARKQQHGGQ